MFRVSVKCMKLPDLYENHCIGILKIKINMLIMLSFVIYIQTAIFHAAGWFEERTTSFAFIKYVQRIDFKNII